MSTPRIEITISAYDGESDGSISVLCRIEGTAAKLLEQTDEVKAAYLTTALTSIARCERELRERHVRRVLGEGRRGAGAEVGSPARPRQAGAPALPNRREDSGAPMKRCRRCPGQILDFGDEERCAQCGRPPEAPRMLSESERKKGLEAREDARFRGMDKVMRQR